VIPITTLLGRRTNSAHDKITGKTGVQLTGTRLKLGATILRGPIEQWLLPQAGDTEVLEAFNSLTAKAVNRHILLRQWTGAFGSTVLSVR